MLIFLALGFAIYAPALRGGKIWDDHYLIGENPLFRSPVFAAEVFRHHLFFESQSTYYRPVQNLTYIADYWMWGDNPTGFHVTNILLHIIAAWLLWSVLRRILPGMGAREPAAGWMAFCVALVWLVHPVHNAAVAYISGRADSLAAVFALGAWLLFLRCEGAGRVARADRVRAVSLGLAAAVCVLLAMCSKEIALVWLLIFTIHRVFFSSGIPWLRRLAPVFCALILTGVYAWLRTLPLPRAPQPVAVSEGIGGRSVLALRALGDYAGLIVFPGKLMMERTLGSASMYRSREDWMAGIANEWLSVLGVAALFIGVWLAVWKGATRPIRRFGVLWFGVAFIPISNLIPLNAQVAEHWIYAASIGALLLVAGAVPADRRCLIAVLVIAGALGVRTSFRAADWADAETFARKTIDDGGASGRMLAYLAQELGTQKRHEEQEAVLRRAVALFPDYGTARVNLGICLEKQGRAGEAKQLFQVGKPADTAATPRNWNGALNAAAGLHKLGKSDAALALLREWRLRNPETWELVAEEAAILAAVQSPGAAIPVIAKFADAHWWHYPSHIGLAGFQREAGALDAARESAMAAARLDVHGADAYAELARIEAEAGRNDSALEAAGTAILRAPRNAAHYFLLAAVLDRAGRSADAAAAKRKAESLSR